MKKYVFLSTLVSAGSLFMALTVGAQSNEFGDTETVQPSTTLPATPVENEAPPSSIPAESSPSPGTSTVVPLPSGQQTLISSATMVGVGVKNTQGETIGDIQEIMIDPGTGKVTYAMVTYIGQWGMGKQKSFAVPWEALEVAFNQTEVVVELKSDNLSLSPHIELSQRQ